MPILSDYIGLIPYPNNNKPNFIAWLTGYVQLLLNNITMLESIIDAFNLELAVGDQLDVAGQILNLSRKVSFQPSGGASPVLDDDTYRIVLKAKVFQNQWKGTIPEIYDYWIKTFPEYPILIQDNQDMTMTVLVLGTGPGILQDLVVNGYFVPKPSGVRVNYGFSLNPIFSYGLDTTYLKGYNQGYWASI